MKLYKNYGISGQETLSLPNDLQWKDEFSWTAAEHKKSYTLTGAMIVETAVKLAGRPIGLEAPTDDMAWVPRTTVETLYLWAGAANTVYRLVFE